jgi:SAV_6107-like HEPN
MTTAPSSALAVRHRTVAPAPAAAPPAPAAPAAAAPVAPPATAAPTAAAASAGPTAATVPAGSTSRLPASTLLALARRGLVEAGDAATAGERYAAAHLAALRVAAAVLACRARPVDGATATPRRTRPTSAWVLLAAVAPELGEWAAFFAAGAAKRAAAEAGLPSAVTPREADDLVRDVEAFLAMVEGSLGLPSQLLLASG